MMTNLSTPQAIVIGSVIISAGIYLGLNKQTTSDTPNLAYSAPLPRTSLQPQPTALDQNLLTQQLNEQLASIKPELLKTCPAQWSTVSNRYTIDTVFNADGQQIARGFSEARGNSNPGLANCLSSSLPVFRIQPTGITVKVVTDLFLP